MSKVCAVVGLGSQGIGDHVAQKFSSEGYAVAMMARSLNTIKNLETSIPRSKAYQCDAGDSDQVSSTVQNIMADFGRIDVLIYNVGAGMFKTFSETTEDEFEMCWKSGPKGLFSFAKAVLPIMEGQKSKGVLGVTGATASWRGMPSTAAFAPNKFAVRALTQSLARDYGPKGIHVFHVIIDGIVDIPRTRQWMAAKPSEEFMKPNEIADAYWYLCNQPQSVWTQELNLAPGPVYAGMVSI